MFVLVALSALVAGGLGAFIVARTWMRPGHDGGDPRSGASQGLTLPPADSVAPTAQAAPPLIVPAPESTTTADSATPPVVEPAKVQKGGHTPPPPPPPPSVKATAKPVDTAVPVTTGVAPGLKLKLD